MREKVIYVIILIIGLSLMLDGAIEILERDKQQTEQIKLLEQSLNEQIQEKEVYMKMLEDEYEQYTR